MANYLERVAASAGRRAATAKPPSSGPPLLPARDFSLPAKGSLPSDDDQFFDASSQSRSQKHEPSRSEGRSEIMPKHESSRPEGRSEIMPTSGLEVAGDSGTTELRDTSIPRRVAPAAKSPASQELLSSESPFTVHLPKTLRPLTAAKLPPPVADEQAGERVPSPASNDPASTGFTIEEEPANVTQPSNSAPRESVRPEVETEKLPVRTKAPVPSDQRQPPAVREIETEALPIPRVDREDRPNKIPVHPTSHRDESLPAVSPVHMPPVVVGNAARQEPSRISIGSLEVMVNGHQPVDPVRPPASAPLPSEKVNLERRYLDRFRLRH